LVLLPKQKQKGVSTTISGKIAPSGIVTIATSKLFVPETSVIIPELPVPEVVESDDNELEDVDITPVSGVSKVQSYLVQRPQTRQDFSLKSRIYFNPVNTLNVFILLLQLSTIPVFE
jgi:hypothetical protein